MHQLPFEIATRKVLVKRDTPTDPARGTVPEQRTIPELIKYQKQIEGEQEAEIYYGIEGLETVFYEQLRTLNKGEASYVIGITSFQDYPKNIAEFFRLLQLKRDRKGVKSYFLLSEDARGTFEYMKKSKYSFLRHIPYASLVSINIYNDITIIGVFLSRPILFKIKSKEVADTFMKYFHMLWEQGKE